MRSIFKYPAPIEDELVLKLPEGAEILAIQVQDEEPRIWALVDPDSRKVRPDTLTVPRSGRDSATSGCRARRRP